MNRNDAKVLTDSDFCCFSKELATRIRVNCCQRLLDQFIHTRVRMAASVSGPHALGLVVGVKQRLQRG